MNIFSIASFLDIGAIVFYKYSILYKYMAFEIGFLLPVIAGIIAIFKKSRLCSYLYILVGRLCLLLCFYQKSFSLR